MPYKHVWATDTTMHCHFLGKVGFADLTHATNDFYNDIRVDRTDNAVIFSNHAARRSLLQSFPKGRREFLGFAL